MAFNNRDAWDCASDVSDYALQKWQKSWENGLRAARSERHGRMAWPMKLKSGTRIVAPYFNFTRMLGLEWSSGARRPSELLFK
jgi:hypothetical protein